jgi:hypothetical protein
MNPGHRRRQITCAPTPQARARAYIRRASRGIFSLNTRLRAPLCTIGYSCTLFLATQLACGGGGGGDDGATSPGGSSTVPAVFTASPLPAGNIANIVPLGNLNPPEHALPTDHIYLVIDPPLNPSNPAHIAVFAPGTGTINSIDHGNDDGVLITMNSSVSYVLGHITLSSSLGLGSKVTAGQQIGVTSGLSGALDLGVLNSARSHSFITPGRYPGNTLRCDAPISFFTEPLRTDLYAKVTRLSSDKDGTIDFDDAGHLGGNWFLLGVPADVTSSSPAAWGKQIAFVFDNIQPAKARISIGGSVSLAGVFEPDASDPAFSAVSPSSGVVLYHLYTAEGLGSQAQRTLVGSMLVQMETATQIRVETFAGTASASAFTSNAKIFVR